MLKPELKQFHFYQETTDGVFGLFDTPEQLVVAANKTKEKNYKGFDCLTPFPVHGLDDAMDLPRSGIPWVTFFMGLFGCSIGFGFQYLVHVADWQMNISGKALNAWPAFIPVTFEATVFFAGVSSAAALFVLGGLTNFFRKPLHPDITSHKFALWIPSSAPGFNESEVTNFIKSLGATEVQAIRSEKK